MTADDVWTQIVQACEGKGGKKGLREPVPFAELLRMGEGLKVLRAKVKEPAGPHKKEQFYQAALEFVRSEAFRSEKSFAPFLDEVTDACGRWRSTGEVFWRLWLERCRLGKMDSHKAFAAALKEQFRNGGGQLFSDIKGFHNLDNRSKVDLLKTAFDALDIANADPEFRDRLRKAIDTIQQKFASGNVVPPTPVKPIPSPPLPTVPVSSGPIIPPQLHSVPVSSEPVAEASFATSLPEPTEVLVPRREEVSEFDDRISAESVTTVDVAAIPAESPLGDDMPKGKKSAKTKPPVPPAADVSAMISLGTRVAEAVEKVVEKLGSLDTVPAVLRELTAKLDDRDRLAADLAAAQLQVQSLSGDIRSKEIRLADEIVRGEDLARQLEQAAARIGAAEARAKAAEAAVASVDDDIREIRLRSENAVQSFRASLAEALGREFVDIAAVPAERERSAERADVFHRRLAAIRTMCRENGIDIPEPKRLP